MAGKSLRGRAEKKSPAKASPSIFSAVDLRGDRSTLSDAVANRIARDILRGDLASGDRFPNEQELCDLLGVSRTVVRDAIRTLSARGLVEVRQGVGMTVTTPDDTVVSESLMALVMRSDVSVGDVLDARRALETQIASMAAERGGAADWASLEASLAAFSEAVDAERWQEAHDRHLDFHLGILAAVHLPAVQLMLLPMQHFVVVSSLAPQRDDKAAWEVPSHEPILESLRAGDPAAARDAMERHFEYTEAPKYRELRATRFREVAKLEAMAGVTTTPRSGRDGDARPLSS